MYAIALGHEDLNDHEALRSDLALQTALHRDAALASPATLCRLENRADRDTAAALHEVLVERFVASFERAPKRLVLDVDATDDRVHGDQEGRFFHGYYDHYCFLPLYVFCGERLRRAWPEVEILVRGDSGFCRWRMLRWFDRHGVDYVIGAARNARLLAVSAPLRGMAERRHRASGQKQRLFGEIRYGARLGRRPTRDRQARARRPGAAIRASWSPASNTTRNTSTTASTAPAATWRTASRSSS